MNNKYYKLFYYSNPLKAQKKAEKWLGKGVQLFPSSKIDKKYMIKNNNKWIHFGQMGYEDYLFHNSIKRKNSYHSRAENIKGNWKNDKYSPNNLSLHILW